MKVQKILILFFSLAVMLGLISTAEAQVAPPGSGTRGSRTHLIRFTGGKRSPTVPPPLAPDAAGAANQQSGAISSCDNDNFRPVYSSDSNTIQGYGFPANEYVLAIVTPYKPTAASDYVVFWAVSDDSGSVYFDDLTFIGQAGMDPSMTVLVGSDGWYMGRCANQAAMAYPDARDLYNDYFVHSPPDSSQVGTGAVETAVPPTGDVLVPIVVPQDQSPFGSAPQLQVFSGDNGVIYGVTASLNLLWFRHDGRDDGSATWATDAGIQVGNSWNFKSVFGGGNGVVYAIRDNGELLWFRHYGQANGSQDWDPNGGVVISNNWFFKQVFAAGNGVIYAVDDQNNLLWYRHDGWQDGTDNWASNSGSVVGTSWVFKEIFSGGNGVVYAIRDNGEMLWFRNYGEADGSNNNWASNGGTVISNNWFFQHVFSGGDGVIYAIDDNYRMLWYRHDGWSDGSNNWASNSGAIISSGWNLS